MRIYLWVGRFAFIRYIIKRARSWRLLLYNEHILTVACQVWQPRILLAQSLMMKGALWALITSTCIDDLLLFSAHIHDILLIVRVLLIDCSLDHDLLCLLTLTTFVYEAIVKHRCARVLNMAFHTWIIIYWITSLSQEVLLLFTVSVRVTLNPSVGLLLYI